MGDAARIEAGMCLRSQGYSMWLDHTPDANGDPTIETWVFTAEGEAEEGHGWLEVAVHEVIATERSGTLVVYYRQWFAPDGEPIARRVRRVGSVGSLKAMIRRRKMTPINGGSNG